MNSNVEMAVVKKNDRNKIISFIKAYIFHITSLHECYL